MRALLMAAVLVAPAPALLAAQALPPASRVAQVIDSLARAFVAEGFSPSVAIGVVRGRDTLAMRAWGKADLEQNVDATAATVYRIGSVTKQFTSAAVMRLMEEGKVKLDDSIAAYLPTLPAAWRPVTVRQLLNHTSGIPSYTDLGVKWQRRWGEEMPPDTLVALTASLPMDFAPGTRWKYDNTGYVLLGMLIEKVTGKTWAADLEARFAIPLGLAGTRNCLTGPLIPHRAHGYAKEKDAWVNSAFLEMTQPYSAGAMCSTIGDLAAWNRALHLGKVVSAASYQMMITPSGAAATTRRGYGFGLGPDSLGGRPAITHGGGIHGFITANGWVPSAELSLTVLTNSGSAPANQLLAQLARAALGVPLVRPPAVVALTAADQARYAGVYALMLGGTARDFTVAIEGNRLTGQLVGQGANPIIHYGNHTFGLEADSAVRLIFTVENDRAVKLTLVQGGGRFEGVRK